MPYAPCLASCSMALLSDVFHSTLTKLSLSSGVLLIGALLVLRYSPYWSSACPMIWGFAASFI